MDAYSWEFGDGAASSAEDPVHVYSAPGSYNVSLKATKSGCSKTCPGSVVIKPIPDCSWTSNAPVCDGTPVQLTGPSGMDAYQWDFGDGGVSSIKDPSHLYSAPGTYTVNLKATKNGCSKTCPGTVEVTAIDCSWTSSSPVCNGTPVQFTGPSGMDSWYWDFGDGAVSSAQDPSHLYSAPGKYPVNLNVIQGGSSKLCTKEITVTPVPNCTIAAPDSICAGATGSASTTATPRAAYNWSITNGEITPPNDTQSINFTAGAPGTIRLTVNVTAASGCSNKCTKDITVTAGPDCSWTSNAPVCDGTPIQFTGPSGMDSWDWDFGDGQVGSGQGASHLYSANGTYSVSLTVANKCGSKSCSGTVEIKSQPNCSWSSNAPVCDGTPVQFNGPLGMESYQWEFGDGQISSAQDASHLYSANGTYSVNLTVANKCGSKSCSGTVEIKSQPDCSWTSSSPVCNGTPVQFTGPAEMDAYHWEFGDGAVSSAQDASHLYSANGTYSVNLTVANKCGSKSCSGTVEIKPQPDCSWSSNAPVCDGTPVQFAGPTGMDAYQWDFGDRSPVSSAKDPSHLYRAQGNYDVVLTVTNNSCSTTCGGKVVVKPMPDCTISAPYSVCAGSTGNAASTATPGAAYAWSITNGQITSAINNQSINFTAGSPGTTKLEVTVTAGGCAKECSKNITVTSGPDCSWTSSSPVCNGTPVQFTGPSGMDSYNWSFGDDSPFNFSKDPSHLYSANGTYSVNLTVAKGSCSNKCAKDITVTPGPDCTISAPYSVCAGSTGSASTATAGAAYAWAITNGEITSASDAQSITFAAGTSGTARLKVKVTTADGCSKECSKDISIISEPDCSWTSNAPVCDGTPVQFSGPAGMDSYYWDFGDGQVVSSKDPAHLYSAPGTYTVNLKVTRGVCGSKTCKGSVVVKEMPDCNITAPNSVCAGSTGNAASTATAGAAYAWSITNGEITSAINNQSINFTAGPQGIAKLKVTVTDGGCSRECFKNISIISGLNCSWTSNSPVCNGTPVNFIGPAGENYSYLWDFGDNQAISAQSPPISTLLRATTRSSSR
jgi:PKD repeat protein